MFTIRVTKEVVTHLGDGVYAKWSGYDIQLSVNDHRNPPCVFLEPSVMEALIRFYEQTKQTKQTQTT